MNDIRLVGLDLDGTLLGKDRTLTPTTLEVMERVSAHNVNLAIVSGRSFPVVPQVIRNLPFMRYFVLCNGAAIYDKLEDRMIYQAQIPFDNAIKIYDSLAEYPDVYLDCYHDDGCWAREEDYARIDEIIADQTHRDLLYNTRKPVANLRQALANRGKPIQKLQTIYKNSEIRDAEMKRIAALYPELALTGAFTYNIEINVPEATKGIGLLKLAELLGLSREQVIAFGDGSNDISMLQCAGIGYAMANAPDYVKVKADRIAPPNTEDGVAQVLSDLLL